jgi:predicted phage baseplate assembly protein
MPLLAPVLDDRNFAQIVAEAKTLIPRYTPEWTDFNESDPGITLLQLFGWMTDMLLYRVNRVPDRNYIEFLRLLGIELQPAHPASVELTFTLARKDVDVVMVPKGTQIAAASSGGEAPTIFETNETLIALGAKLAAIQSFDAFSYSNETTKNGAAGQTFHPFGPRAREESALLFGFDTPLAFTSQQVNLMVYVHADDTNPITHCDIDLATAPPPATFVWEYYDGTDWQHFEIDKDETRAFTRSGHIYFPGPGTRIKRAIIGDTTAPLYWICARLADATYEKAPELESILINTITATQALTVRSEVLGSTDGRPGQTFRLGSAPVVVRERAEQVGGVTITSLRLEIDEGHGFEVWQEVDDFHASKPDDAHYRLNRTTGEIAFGDGEHGRIPVANFTPAPNVIAREYRYGGGKAGNVAANTVTAMQTTVESVASVTNLRGGTGGSEEETLAAAKLRAPLALKSKNRAVTADDFEYLAKATPGARLRRAKALPLVHPRFGTVTVPGVVTVVIVPDGDAPNPVPNEATRLLVCKHLNLHRLLTSEVYVIGPTYRLVRIEADVIAKASGDLAEVKHGIEAALSRFLHPLTGGEDGQGWPFGGTIFYSDVYRVLLQVPNALRLRDNQLVIWLDEERQTFCRDVEIGQGELIWNDGHDIKVAYA